MNAKEYLQQIETINTRIEQLNEEYMKAESIANSTTRPFNPDVIQTSPDRGRREDAIGRMAKLTKKILQAQVKQAEKREEIVSKIHELDNAKYIDVLYKRYVDCMPLEVVAKEMKKSNGEEYSYDHIIRLHGRALEAFRKIYGE